LKKKKSLKKPVKKKRKEIFSKSAYPNFLKGRIPLFLPFPHSPHSQPLEMG